MKPIKRRTFLSALAATGGAASVLGKPADAVNQLIPYVIPPEQIRSGQWVHFATTCRECPAGCGMHVRHRDGRIIKPEGNPQQPINRGGLCPRGQSAPQGLYDPDRIRGPQKADGRGGFQPVSWERTLPQLEELLARAGGRVVLITDLQTGTLRQTMTEFLVSHGSDRLLVYEPFNYEPLRAAHRKLFGIEGIPQYRLADCDVIVSFGADFLETWISPVEYAVDFAAFHAVKADGRLGRMIYVGPRLSMTAANADEFLMVPPGEARWVALAMVQSLLSQGLVRGDAAGVRAAAAALAGGRRGMTLTLSAERIAALAREFVQARNSLALAGPVAARDSAVAQDCALAAALLNYAAGRVGSTVDFSALHAFGATATERQTEAFLESIGPDDVVLIHNTNLVFTRPQAADALRRARVVIYLNTLPDETAQYASWLLPIDSPLESWGDYEPYTGLHGLMQPTMGRVVDSLGTGEILLGLSAPAPEGSRAPADFSAALRRRWQQLHARLAAGSDFDSFWKAALREGFFVERATGSAAAVALRPEALRPFTDAMAGSGESRSLALWLWPSIMLYDGRLANRGWLQEAPEPVSYAVWSAWVDLHPETARRYKIAADALVELRQGALTNTLPVRITEEIAPGCAGVMLGQGHTAPGLSLARGIGANPFELLLVAEGHVFGMVSVRDRDGHRRPVYAAPTKDQYHREIVKTLRLSDLQSGKISPEEIIYPLAAGFDPHRDLYPPHQHRGHRWAMVVDLQRCIGCGACGVACYAENNIPVMGAEPVDNGREMAWLKIVPYRLPETGGLAWLPMLCQHCDAAPCEPVCPVFAAVHNDEGLNAQIYNRCVGTRYCNNNCPYKVRRFNWFNVTWRKPLDLQLNPEVTVRCRGVMEKCTFCVQRIREAQYRALRERRRVRDGEIQPACVQSCPTRVYTFGDLLDPESAVSRLIKCDPRRYQVLRELNTKPAVIYLKKVIRESGRG